MSRNCKTLSKKFKEHYPNFYKLTPHELDRLDSNVIVGDRHSLNFRAYIHKRVVIRIRRIYERLDRQFLNYNENEYTEPCRMITLGIQTPKAVIDEVLSKGGGELVLPLYYFDDEENETYPLLTSYLADKYRMFKCMVNCINILQEED